MKLQNYSIETCWDSYKDRIDKLLTVDVNLDFVESCTKLPTKHSFDCVHNIVKRPWYLLDQNESYEEYLGEYQLYRWRMRSGKEYLFKECIDIDSKEVK